MKEIKEIFRFAHLCAQRVPKALSLISFISAGQKKEKKDEADF